MGIIKYIANLPLVSELRSFKGNTRCMVYTEPMFSIPKTLFTPFTTVYMHSLGLGDEHIGIIASVHLFASIFFALFAGAVADKMGRRNALFVWDLFAWSVPMLIWTLARDFWWFLIAALINSAQYIATTAWSCLLAESADKKQLVNAYSYVYISGQLAALFAPLAGFLVNRLTVVPAVRVMYALAFVSITARVFVFRRYTVETDAGKARCAEAKNKPLWRSFQGYVGILRLLLSSKPMLMSLTVMFIVNVTIYVNAANFYGLYITQNMGLPDAWLAYFPILRAAAMLGFAFGIHHLLYRYSIRTPMLAGLALYTASQLAFVFSEGANSLAVAIVYTVCEALAYAIVVPGSESIAALVVEPRRRAQLLGMMTVVMLAASAPFGVISGWIAQTDRRLIFAMNALLYITAFVIVAKSKTLANAHTGEMS